MPLQSSITGLFGKLRRSGLNISNYISKMRKDSPDAAEALTQVQEAVHAIENALRNPDSTINQFVVTDPSGAVVAALGQFVFSGSTPETNYFSALTIGDNPDPTQAANVLTIIPASIGSAFILIKSNAAFRTEINSGVMNVFSATKSGGITPGTVAVIDSTVPAFPVTSQMTPSKLQIGALPNASPGAGSKQMFYDPADGNRVKYAP